MSVDHFEVSVVRLMEVSVLSGEFGYSKMTEERPGPAPGVRLIEVSVKSSRELTVHEIKFDSSLSLKLCLNLR